MSDTQKDWVLDEDVSSEASTEQITTAPPVLPPATIAPAKGPDVHEVGGLVLPKPTALQKPALPRMNNQPPVVSADDKAECDALENHPDRLRLIFGVMKACNPVLPGVVATQKVLAKYFYARELWGKWQQADRHQLTDAQIAADRKKVALSLRNAEKNRQASISALYAALEKNEFLPARSGLDAQQWKETLDFINQPQTQAEIGEILRSQAMYAVQWFESFLYHCTSTRQREHTVILGLNPSAEEKEQIHTEIDLLKSGSFRFQSNANASALISCCGSDVKPKLVSFSESCELHLSECKLAALANVRNLLRDQGGDADLASFTKRIDFQLATVRHYLAAFKQPRAGFQDPRHPMQVPGIESVLQFVFKIPLLPEPAQAQP